MKGQNKSLIWMLLAMFTVAINAPLNAQDDLYYDPATDSKPVQTYEENYDEPSNVTRRYNEDDQYYDEDDYAYEYSSRIRRFHRPARAIDYYDPFFVDLYYYDPFFLPGASIYTYGFNDYWSWRRWQRWQRWNTWNSPAFGWGWNSWGYNSWGWNSPYYGGWNAWNNPCVWNNYYYDPYWTWNGYNPYYGNTWVNNNYYYNNGENGNNGYRPQTYTGPRRGGTSVNPGYARLANGSSNNGRLVVADNGAPVIDMKARPSGRVAEKEKPSQQAAGRKPAEAAANPAQTGRGQANDQQVEKVRPATDTRPSREVAPNNDVTPSRRPATQPTETRPSRNQETTPTRRNEETRPARQPREETRPTRRNEETRPSRSSGGSEEARPSRRSSEETRPSRSSGGNIESRPSRSNDSGSRIQTSPSRSSGGNSGSSGGSRGGSSGGGSKSSGGGSRGRGN